MTFFLHLNENKPVSLKDTQESYKRTGNGASFTYSPKNANLVPQSLLCIGLNKHQGHDTLNVTFSDTYMSFIHPSTHPSIHSFISNTFH